MIFVYFYVVIVSYLIVTLKINKQRRIEKNTFKTYQVEELFSLFLYTYNY